MLIPSLIIAATEINCSVVDNETELESELAHLKRECDKLDGGGATFSYSSVCADGIMISFLVMMGQEVPIIRKI